MLSHEIEELLAERLVNRIEQGNTQILTKIGYKLNHEHNKMSNPSNVMAFADT